MQVRISDQSHEILREIATDEKRPMQAILDELIESRRRDRYYARINAQFAALRSDPEESRELDGEIRLFEGTLMDGLREE